MAATLTMLRARVGTDVFTVRDVYAQMRAAGTRDVESTVFKTLQHMKSPHLWSQSAVPGRF